MPYNDYSNSNRSGGPTRNPPPDRNELVKTIAKYVGLLLLGITMFSVGCSSCATVNPGNRGVKVTFGKVDTTSYPSGLLFKAPFVTDVQEVSVRQEKKNADAPCYSADLQQITATLTILYRVPDASVVRVFRDYAGDPFHSLIAPRAQEALKEVTAHLSAEQIVKQREAVKQQALALTRTKVGDILLVDDIVIENLTLSKDLENAIEAKMVQEQEAEKAKFTQQKAEIEATIELTKARGLANAAVARAEGDAKALKVRGDALRENPSVLQLELVQKWNGVTPQVVGGGSGVNILFPATQSK